MNPAYATGFAFSVSSSTSVPMCRFENGGFWRISDDTKRSKHAPMLAKKEQQTAARRRGRRGGGG
jgi:hypothetical protein